MRVLTCFLFSRIRTQPYVCTCTPFVEWLICWQDIPEPLTVQPRGDDPFSSIHWVQNDPITGWFNTGGLLSPPYPNHNAGIYNREEQRHPSSREEYRFCRAPVELHADFGHTREMHLHNGNETEPANPSLSHLAGIGGYQVTTLAPAELSPVENNNVGTQNSKKRKGEATSDQKGQKRKRKRARRPPRNPEAQEKIPVGILEVCTA